MQFQNVVWTGERFVATGSALDGSGGAILDSSDGFTWNRQVIEAADQMPGALAAGPRGVVAVGMVEDHPAVWISRDGLSWTVRTDAFQVRPEGDLSGPTRFTVQGVVATDDGWLAVGRVDPVCQLDCGTHPVRPLVWRSTDGLGWTSVAVAAGPDGGGMNAITRSPIGYIAVGLGTSRAAVWTSHEGTTWTAVVDKPVFHSRLANPGFWMEMIDVAADHGVIVAVGMGGPQGGSNNAVRAWWSLDGASWSEATGEGFGGGQAFGLTSTRVGFLATGPSSPESCLGGMWGSADGRAWECVASDPSFAGFGPYAAAASPSVVVAVGLDTSAPESDQGFPGEVWRKLLP